MQRFCENCIVMCSKLNDTSQWLNKAEGSFKKNSIESIEFSEVMIQTVKDKTLAKVFF